MHGDCYDRFLIRMNEMCECINIINQIIDKLTKFNIINFNKNQVEKKINKNITTIHPHIVANYLSLGNLNRFNYNNSYTSMENLIKHFKF
jgi:NADH:ubiquinone oxidoreductase subunit D